ncbi:SLIT-ROBO Rho GTPase-activating protein 1-like [Eupeodes corollae]|uniref:SLIT-ROBO Rho GTPase-activating protein 1-like n=1 Tax=Eupeodes corollae TaxID=290404 RepID=UPI00248FB417|nr:SLIT-ROBO Rho GTPase-activating protein 1-like [Eupeodes corollae]
MQANPSAGDNDNETANHIQCLGSIKKLILFNNIRLRLLEQLCSLDVKAESHMCFVNELNTFFRHRTIVESEHSRGLEKILNYLQSNICKSQSSVQWPSQSSYCCWDLLINETWSLANDYSSLSEIYNIDVVYKLQKIQLVYNKYYELLSETHEEILRILRNFYTTITTYNIYKKNQYSSDKLEAIKSRSIYKHFTETSNVDIHKNMLRDLKDIFNSMDLGFGLMVSKAILAHVSSEQKLFKNRLHCLNEEDLSRNAAGVDCKNKSIEQNCDHFSKQNIPKLLRQSNHNNTEGIESLLHFEFELQTQLLNLREKKLRKNLEVIYGILDTREMKTANFVRTKKSMNAYDNGSQIDIKPKTCAVKSLSNSGLSTMIKQIAFKTNANINASESKAKVNLANVQIRPKLFGGSLEEYLKITNEPIPLILRSCIRVIRKYGLHSHGIFRVSGSQIEIMNFRESFERGEDPLVGASDASDMNSVAGVLKLYLRELQEPLFPSKYFGFFISIQHLDSEQEVVGEMRNFFRAISQPVVIVIRFLFGFLNHLSEYSSTNMMDAFNLAISFGPTLMPTPEDKKQVQYQTQLNELIKIIIMNYQEIFPNDLAGPRYHKHGADNYFSDSSNDAAE